MFSLNKGYLKVLIVFVLFSSRFSKVRLLTPLYLQEFTQCLAFPLPTCIYLLQNYFNWQTIEWSHVTIYLQISHLKQNNIIQLLSYFPSISNAFLLCPFLSNLNWKIRFNKSINPWQYQVGRNFNIFAIVKRFAVRSSVRTIRPLRFYWWFCLMLRRYSSPQL